MGLLWKEMPFQYSREKSKPHLHLQRLAARGEGIQPLFTETEAEVPVCDTVPASPFPPRPVTFVFLTTLMPHPPPGGFSSAEVS